jgi:hypothetical protein
VLRVCCLLVRVSGFKVGGDEKRLQGGVERLQSFGGANWAEMR